MATDVGIVSRSASISRIWLFAPPGYAVDDLVRVNPETSLKTLLKVDVHSSSGWVLREDLLDETAAFIRKEGRRYGSWLFCEPEYTAIGDKWLKSRPHFLIGDRPILYLMTGQKNVAQIATFLRQARSRRLLGVVCEHNAVPFVPASDGLLVADAFAVDSAICVELRRDESSGCK